MSKTILLADDSLTIQKVVELTFADTDFEVVSTSSGDELLEKLSGVSPDVIICDTIMPGSDGYLVCQRIKSEPSTLHIPVILLTGTFEPFDRDRALAAGCSEIITKPFEARRLVETVERLVSGGEVAAPAASEPVDGAVAPPHFAGAVPPPPVEQQGAAEFGTLLAEPIADEGAPFDEQPPDEGLDFTSTGFAEMEQAAETAGVVHDHLPDDGLDYEPPDDAAPFADLPAEDADDPAASDAPFAESDAEEDQPVDEFDPDEDIFDDEPAAMDEGTAESFDTDETVVETPDFGGPIAAQEPMAASMPVDPPAAEDVGDFEYGAPAEQGQEQPEPLSEFGEVEQVETDVEELEQVETDVEELEQVETDVEELEQIETVIEVERDAELEVAEPTEELEQVGATPVVPPVPAPAPAEATPPQAGELSDQDVDRIARRVVELAADRLEQIAWEVIPDMAEIVVRERLRELEAEVERQPDAPAN